MDEYDQPITPDGRYDPEIVNKSSAIFTSPFAADVLPAYKIHPEYVEKLYETVQDTNLTIKKRLDMIEALDISVSIATFKVYEATNEFKKKINDIKDERNLLLSSVANKSELSLILHDLDRKISDLNKKLETRITELNQQKIEFQENMENVIAQLDEDTAVMRSGLNELKTSIGLIHDYDNVIKPQIYTLNEKYVSLIEELETNLKFYEHLQLTGWRVEKSEIKLAELLQEQGLQFTPSGTLLTRTGSRLTFQEAQRKGYLDKIDSSMNKIIDFFKDRDRAQELLQEPSASARSTSLTESTSVDSTLTSEDVKYLQQHVGKPLTLALAEIAAKQPRDPIHYLGHYLFKYRYNQEIEEVKKREVEELMKERQIQSEARWKKFVEEEAKRAVMDMICRAEETALENELKRIALEQMLAAEEEEGDEEERALKEEARDKFE